MADAPFLLLSDKWRVAHDPLQWIIQRRGAFKAKVGERRWTAVAYIATRRDILFRVLRELEAEVDPDALDALDDLPQTFKEWSKGQAKNTPMRRNKGGPSAIPGVASIGSREAA